MRRGASGLGAAQAAYDAAKTNPVVYATSTPGFPDDDGGGAYDDSNVADEFYWAAAELFITTGEASYRTDFEDSSHHATLSTGVGPFNWQSTAGLGVMSLATVPSDLEAAALNQVRAAVVVAANTYAQRASQAYGTAIQEYWWGSNSDVLNAGMVMALAYDLTGEAAYRAGALGALDYVLGRNPLGQSYVTGYGTQTFQNLHHRFFAQWYSASWPAPPPGIIAGGPNRNLDGLTPVGGLAGCKDPKCWTDNPQAHGLTEVTINWNAPLAWLAAWGSEQETNPKTNFPGVDDVPPPGGTGGSGSDDGQDDEPSGESGAGGAGDTDDVDDGDDDAGGVGEDMLLGGSSSGCGCTHAGLSYAPQGLSVALLGLWMVRRRRRLIR